MFRFVKELFCKHEWINDRECIVHYPDYEPHKVGVIRHCEKCGKRDRILYLPYDYIQKFGREKYEEIVRSK